ncbi:hypothetical protein [Vibrio penaeicida]|uniref:Uncharacterized protein n=1 Tax=Vibrio penaeicida TaxID=104609 RepID=A0AAV5NKN8_9VIBR|nr:hypothetical protein [Vibrio penaeicida]RTZ24900.1 hypothetical protein EKN09_01120 [Vibrio penaeicida]GLQ71215.1 hypothetical protein GCM10007932_05750 [Vibrio penaeicida]
MKTEIEFARSNVRDTWAMLRITILLTAIFSVSGIVGFTQTEISLRTYQSIAKAVEPIQCLPQSIEDTLQDYRISQFEYFRIKKEVEDLLKVGLNANNITSSCPTPSQVKEAL